MMRNMPYCPLCEDEVLTLVRDAKWVVCRCQECGWRYTFAPAPAEKDLAVAIATIVAKARTQHDPGCHQ